MNTEKRDFDQEAAAWDENPGRVKTAKDIAASIISNVSLTPDMDALEFGCGTGLVSLQLQPLVRSITGVDSSNGMLEVFRSKIARLKLTNVNTVFLNPERGDSLTGTYQLVVSSMTLHHLPDFRPLLGQLYAVTAPGGHLCIADLDAEEGRFHDNNTGVFHFGFDRESLRTEVEAAGFVNTAFVTAAEISKPSPTGEMRNFTVFLLTARKD
jgi:ubiquinone/menaquinone biosynthesis C-methylase UbiE